MWAIVGVGETRLRCVAASGVNTKQGGPHALPLLKRSVLAQYLKGKGICSGSDTKRRRGEEKRRTAAAWSLVERELKKVKCNFLY
ncbi:hypothetical protein MRB53_032170 [Persea americana]|uniref:Uncharacterized protein n=1 Tax=Persea americana TaxID=3435 RepID=A0ACC2KR44_PERAE|nr:hypothetical protein MRB53_032170 [Persea americana]